MADIVYPTLLVCGFFGIILLVGIGFTYLWLLWLNAAALKCPECGRRGAGELEESEVITRRSYTEWKEGSNILGRQDLAYMDPGRGYLFQAEGKFAVQEDADAIFAPLLRLQIGHRLRHW